MPAYATTRGQLQTLPINLDQKNAVAGVEGPIIDSLITQLAERVATVVVACLAGSGDVSDDWLDSRHAADYLGLHRDTLRKLAAERTIPSEQDGPGCKLYFRRSDLDEWRSGGGRPRHLAAVAARAS